MHDGKHPNTNTVQFYLCYVHTYVFLLRLFILIIEIFFIARYFQEEIPMAYTSTDVSIIIVALVDVLLLILVSMLWVYDCMLVSMIQIENESGKL